MRQRTVTFIAAAALLGAAGCGSDNDANDDQAATTSTAGGGEVTATTAAEPSITQTTTEDSATGDRLSPEGRAVLDASQDLAADVSETAQEFARGRIDQDEAIARLRLAGERADDLRSRAQQLPAADRAGERLSSLNEEINRTADAVSKEVASGRAANSDEIDKRIARLRDEARSAVDAVTRQLDKQAQERFREALDRIGAASPG